MSRQKGDIMREVMISIQPKWVEKIVSGEKTVEVRKTRPKCETPFKCYIYCTMPKNKHDNLVLTPFGYDVGSEGAYCNYTGNSNGKVIGEFVCDRVYNLKCLPNEYSGKPSGTYEQFICENSCLSFDDIKAYGKGTSIYGWHITDLVVYDEPRELSEFLLYNVRTYIDEESGLPMPTHEIARPFQSWGYVKAKEPRQTAD